jgi:hypothetical protein
LRLIDELDVEITGIQNALRATGADHPSVPLLMILPGAGWTLAYTVAGFAGMRSRRRDRRYRLLLQPHQAGRLRRPVPDGVPDRRGPTIEAAAHGARHRVDQERYQRTARRLGRQRGTTIARVDIARRMAETIWHMLTTEQPFAPAGAAQVL